MKLGSVALVLAFLVLPCLGGAAGENPLLKPFGTPFEVPPFDRIETGHYLPAVREGIRIHNSEIEAITANPAPADFGNTVEALDTSGKLLETVRAVFYSQTGACSSDELMAAAREISPLLSSHNDDVMLNDRLFARVKAVYDSREKAKLAPDSLYLLENIYGEFVRGGSLLGPEKRARLREINRELSLLSLKFAENVLSETNGSFVVVDDASSLAGLPESVVAMGAETAREMKMEGKWVFTAQRPSWTPVLQYASDRKLREELYKAYVMRCDRDNERDNKQVLQKLVSLRYERAALLGYSDPAGYHLENRMAKEPKAVTSFLDRLWKPALERAGAEARAMQALIDREKGGFRLAPWDWWYYAEKLRKENYDLDESELRPYFSLDSVSAGVFGLGERLFGLKFIERKDIPVYHPEVKVYEVKDAGGETLGLLYTDFFPRDSKRAGAWSGGFRDSWLEDGKRVIPLSTIVCTFTRPAAGDPSLLSVDEVTTFFHEFGHALNTLLFEGRYRRTFAPLDSVELPSQIMENWALKPELLRSYARHYRTGEPMPQALIEKLRKSRLFNQGFQNVEYLAAAYLDIAWHSKGDPKDRNVTKFEENVMKEIGLIPEILPRYRSVHFSHMIGGYTAGYYAYIWAAVLDADAFGAFKERSLFDRKTALSFRKNILASLGTEDTMTLYKKFRGREPKVEPLLEQRGLLGTDR